MTRTELQKVGETMFGHSWQTDLARALGVADRTVRRWVAGENSIPETLPRDLAALCRQHSAKLKELAEQLAKASNR